MFSWIFGSTSWGWWLLSILWKKKLFWKKFQTMHTLVTILLSPPVLSGLERLTVNTSREPSSNRNSDYDSYGFNWRPVLTEECVSWPWEDLSRQSHLETSRVLWDLVGLSCPLASPARCKYVLEVQLRNPSRIKYEKINKLVST